MRAAMPETADLNFRCDVCGRSHRWSPDLVGQMIPCPCGEPAPVPAGPEGDLYDLSPIKVEPIKTSVIPITEEEHSSVLGYQRPATVTIEEGYSEANPMIVSVPKDLIIPIALIFVGTVAEFVWAFRVSPSPRVAITSVGGDFIMHLVTMLIGVIVAARILGVSFGPVPTAILKLAAIAVGPTGVTMLLVWSLGGGIAVLILGWVLQLAIFVWLFQLFFELDLDDLFNTIVILYGVHMVASFVLHVLVR